MTMTFTEANDITVDLETLGTRFDAPVIAIAMQSFNRDTGKFGAAFYQEINIDSAVKSGRVSGDTLCWWMQQGDRAKQLFNPKREKMHLASALQAMCTFVRGVGQGAPRVWGNGATADVTWLEYALANGSVGLSPPWHYTNIRDVRTITDAAGYDWNDVPFQGTKHWAPDDAAHQARVVSHCWRKIRGLGKAPVKAVVTAEADDDL